MKLIAQTKLRVDYIFNQFNSNIAKWKVQTISSCNKIIFCLLGILVRKTWLQFQGKLLHLCFKINFFRRFSTLCRLFVDSFGSNNRLYGRLFPEKIYFFPIPSLHHDFGSINQTSQQYDRILLNYLHAKSPRVINQHFCKSKLTVLFITFFFRKYIWMLCKKLFANKQFFLKCLFLRRWIMCAQDYSYLVFTYHCHLTISWELKYPHLENGTSLI